jgi:hypothetical protein
MGSSCGDTVSTVFRESNEYGSGSMALALVVERPYRAGDPGKRFAPVPCAFAGRNVSHVALFDFITRT